MTRDEFEREYAERSGTTVERLRYFGRYAEPCDCGESDCNRWAMGHQHEDALFIKWMLEQAMEAIPE